MKLGLIFGVVALCFATGCAHNTPAPNTPNNQANTQEETPALGTPSEQGQDAQQNKPDGFDKTGAVIGHAVAATSREVYVEGRKFIDYVQKPETQKEIGSALRATKDAAFRAYQSALQAYENYMSVHNAEEKPVDTSQDIK